LEIYLLDTLGYLSYLTANVIFLIGVMPLYLLLGLTRAPFRRRLIRSLFRGYCVFLTQFYLPLLKVYRVKEISGRERVPQGQPVVYVSNHRSRIDAILLLGLLRDTATVIKSTYAKLPVFASFVKHLDFAGVDQDSLRSIGNAVHRVKGFVADGKSMLIFPEGSRAKTGRLQPFRDLAFRIAMDAKVPVAPVLCHSTLPFMAKRRGSTFPPGTFDFTVKFLPLQNPEAGERPGDFAARVQRLMARELATLDKGTPWET
jgi:1-acyl-sn-glycerol-3-phosphate acyltransferase